MQSNQKNTDTPIEQVSITGTVERIVHYKEDTGWGNLKHQTRYRSGLEIRWIYFSDRCFPPGQPGRAHLFDGTMGQTHSQFGWELKPRL